MASLEISSSWSPISALVAGVIMGTGNLSFSDIPWGMATPQSVLFPSLYSLAACPDNYPLITISTLNGTQADPTATLGSGVAINQLGTISAVSAIILVAI